ncbi:MAG: hypothetical protein V4662_25155 [Verrucomicrobiota bacterium]
MAIPPHITDPMRHYRDLHDHYCARSGFDIAYNMTRENTWKDWLNHCGYAWAKDEISMVVFYLREEIKIQKRNAGSLKFSNMIGKPDFFEEDLGLARKDRRAAASVRSVSKPSDTPKPAPKSTDTLNSFGEEIEAGKEAAKRFADLLKGDS